MDAPIYDEPVLSQLEGEPHWEPLSMPAILVPINSFLHNTTEGARVRIQYFSDATDQRMKARVWFGPLSEGPPGHVHGGCQASVLDEIMGLATWYHGNHALSGQITINYLKPIPLNKVFTAVGWIDLQDGKKIITKGQLVDDHGEAFAASSGVFVDLGRARFIQLLEQRLGQAPA